MEEILRFPDRVYQKVYYFDEGLGESAFEHVARLKKEIPEMDAEIHRD